jgi:hypothetical protein
MSGTGIFNVLIQWLLCVPPAVTLRKSAFYAHSVYRMVPTGIVSLNSIIWFVFVMETQYVFCEVGSGFLSIMWKN